MIMEFEEVFQRFLEVRPFDETVRHLERHPSAIDTLIQWSETRTPREQNYASWLLLHYTTSAHEKLSDKQIVQIENVFLSTSHPSVQRNTAGILATVATGRAQNGLVLDHAIGLLLDTSSLPALLFHCFKMIEKQFVPLFPELKKELCEVLEILHLRKEPSVQSMYRQYMKKWSAK